MTVQRGWILALGLFGAAATASAQYKSVSPDGHVTYSDLPPPPPARVVQQKKPAADPVTPNPPLPFEVQQAATKYPVTLYTGDRCAPCDEGRAYLRNRGIPFAEKTVTSDDDIALFKQESPDGTAPVVTVGARKSIGFLQSAWSSLLDNAGYPASTALPRDYQNAVATPLSPTTRAPAQSLAPAASPAKRPDAVANEVPLPPVPPAGNPSGFRF
jgi:glutaredoxin